MVRIVKKVFWCVRLCHTLGPGIVLDDGRGFLDSSKVRELGWKPVTDIKTMFKWTLESFL